jgi:adenylate kinase family enzyme
MRESKTAVRGENFQIFEELSENQSLAHNSQEAANPVLATFDVATGAIWSNDALARAIARHRRSGHLLRDEDVETLVHEFARTLDYEDIFERYPSHRERVELMTKRLARDVSRNTAETFANRMMRRERLAEEYVQRVHLEILSNFDRTQKGSGLTGSAISDTAEDRASDWMAKMKHDYRRKAHREYERIMRDQEGAQSGQAGRYAEIWADPDVEQVFVKRVVGMFPAHLSPTLKVLLDRMVKYDISLFVPTMPEADVGHHEESDALYEVQSANR